MHISAVSNRIYSGGYCLKRAAERKDSNNPTAQATDVSFTSHTSAGGVLKKITGLPCSYYGCNMLQGSSMTRIETLLDKCLNLEEASKILSNYTEYMQKVEKTFFERLGNFLEQYPEADIKDYFLSCYDEALTKLKLEEFRVLDRVDTISQELSPATELNIRAKTTRCRQIILENNQEDTFKRKIFLNSLDEITPLPSEVPILEKMKDQALYLPTSGTSENAFIVKYTDRSLQEIAKRLLRTSVVTVEHIKPDSEGGSNSLDNFVLVSAAANSGRSNMPLDKYIDRHPEIPANCQKYMDKIIFLMNNGKLKGHETYPYGIKHRFYTESKSRIDLNLAAYRYTEKEAREREKGASKH